MEKGDGDVGRYHTNSCWCIYGILVVLINDDKVIERLQ